MGLEAILTSGGGSRSTGTLCDAPFCECPTAAWGNVTCRCPSKQASSLVVLRADGPLRLPEHTTTLRVEGCARVEVLERAVHGLRFLRAVELLNNGDVALSPYAFSRPSGAAREMDEEESNEDEDEEEREREREEEDVGGGGSRAEASLSREPGPRFSVAGCRVAGGVPSYAFRGRVREVSLRDCRVEGALAAFSFASLTGTELVEMERCRLPVVESQALKRFSTGRLRLLDVRVDSALPSRALQDVRVRGELRLERVRAPRVRSGAFNVRGPSSVEVVACQWAHVEGEALRVWARGPLRVCDNTFGTVDTGAFRGLTADSDLPNRRRHTPLRLEFFNNSLARTAADGALALDTTVLDARVRALALERRCDCARAKRWAEELGSQVALEEIRCLKKEPGAGVERHPDDAYHSLSDAGCLGPPRGASLTPMLVAVGAGVAVLLVGAVATVVWRRWRRRRRRRGEREDLRRWSPPKDDLKAQQAAAALVLPARTYRETELHVEMERAEPLDK